VNVIEALTAVMRDIQAVGKNDRNETQKFNFRGIDATVNAVGPVLRKHGVIVTPDVETVAYAAVMTAKGVPMTSCRVIVAYAFHGPDGDTVRAKVAAEASDTGDKATPKAMSVAFRTALLQALALPTDEPDPDLFTYETDSDWDAVLNEARTMDLAGLRDLWTRAGVRAAPEYVREAFQAIVEARQ
jgi:ERF superfamily